MTTKAQQIAFIKEIGPLALKVCKERGYGNAQIWTCIAQACNESGFGTSQRMRRSNAYFGIKANKYWIDQAKYGGLVYDSGTKECYDGKTYTNITACFRAYNNLEESIADYFDLITKSSRYRKACVANSPHECITEIKNGGYATSPSYINTIMAIIKDNNLTKYDNVQNVENSVENPSYIKGIVYTLQVDLNVRENAGTEYKIKKFNQLTIDGKKHAYIQENAVLKKGTKVTCLKECKDKKGNIWLQIPSGFIAGFYNNKIYVK